MKIIQGWRYYCKQTLNRQRFQTLPACDLINLTLLIDSIYVESVWKRWRFYFCLLQAHHCWYRGPVRPWTYIQRITVPTCIIVNVTCFSMDGLCYYNTRKKLHYGTVNNTIDQSIVFTVQGQYGPWGWATFFSKGQKKDYWSEGRHYFFGE